MEKGMKLLTALLLLTTTVSAAGFLDRLPTGVTWNDLHQDQYIIRRIIVPVPPGYVDSGEPMARLVCYNVRGERFATYISLNLTDAAWWVKGYNRADTGPSWAIVVKKGEAISKPIYDKACPDKGACYGACHE